MMIWLSIWRGALVGCALASCSSPALAVDALTFPNGPASGVGVLLSGGPGWSFVPTTNLLVTSIGYLDLATAGGDPGAVVTIWAGTNTVIASYTGITDPSAELGDIVSASIPALALTAGQSYLITVYTAPLSASTWSGSLLDNSGLVQYDPFQVAPELAQYRAWQLNPNGTFTPFYPDPAEDQQLLWLGPTFTYLIGSPRPSLTIAETNNNSVLLTWPTNAVGFVLQSSAAVTGTYSNVTNSPSVIGVNYATTLSRTNASAFFRLMKQS